MVKYYKIDLSKNHAYGAYRIYILSILEIPKIGCWKRELHLPGSHMYTWIFCNHLFLVRCEKGGVGRAETERPYWMILMYKDLHFQFLKLLETRCDNVCSKTRSTKPLLKRFKPYKLLNMYEFMLASFGVILDSDEDLWCACINFNVLVTPCARSSLVWRKLQQQHKITPHRR